MTREEAIEILKEIIDEGWLISDNNKCTAINVLEMAIKALEQEPCEDCISRKAVTDTTICEGISCNECSLNTCEDGQSGCLLKERVDKLPPVTPQQPAENWKFYYDHGYAQAKRDLFCEDCISREEALKHSHIEYDDDGEGYRVVYFEDIENLPSVIPQPKIGRWIESTGYDDRDRWYSCSECGRNINLICGARLADYPYCHCGAKMEVEE